MIWFLGFQADIFFSACMFLKCSDWLDIWCARTLPVVLQIRLIISVYRELIRVHIPDVPYPTSKTWIWAWMPKKQAESRVLNFSWSFCLFPLNKSSKQNTETTPARSHLYFAPKITEIHLIALEKELIEVCRLILKTWQNGHACIKSSCTYLLKVW